VTETIAPYVIEGEVLTLTIEEWAEGLRQRVERVKRATWDLIDHLALGDHLFGDKVDQYLDETGFSHGYLRNLRTTGLNFPSSRRVNLPPLPPSFYQDVNPLTQDFQDTMLWIAYNENMTREQMRDLMREMKLTNARETLDVVLENDYLAARNGRLERDNQTLRDAITAREERLAAARHSNEETNGGEDDIFYGQVIDKNTVICPECGAIIEL
jgi:hypothetical protein